MKFSKKIYLEITLFFIGTIIFLSITCTNNSPADTTGEIEILVDKEFWGEWSNFDNYTNGSSDGGYKYYITNNTVTEYLTRDYGVTYPSTDFLFKKISPNIIEIARHWRSEEKYTLIASRVVGGSFTGHAVGDIESRSLHPGRAITGIGGIDVVVSNLNNQADKQRVKTDNDGNFEADDIIIGDEYEVTIEGDADSTIPSFNGEDVGNFLTTGTARSRARLAKGTGVMYHRGQGVSYLCQNEEYALYTEITTYRPYVGKIISWEITLPDGIRSDSQLSTIMQYIQNPFTNRVIDFLYARINLICDPISSEYEVKKIGVKITDEYGECEDFISVRIYRDKVTLSLYVESKDDGFSSDLMIRNPDIANIYTLFNNTQAEVAIEYDYEDAYSDFIWDKVNNCGYRAINLPKYTGAEYLFIIRTVGAINLGIDNVFTPEFINNIESGSAYNTENNAKIVNPAEIIKLNTNGALTFLKLRF